MDTGKRVIGGVDDGDCSLLERVCGKRLTLRTGAERNADIDTDKM